MAPLPVHGSSVQDAFLQKGKRMKQKYMGYAKLEAADVKWCMIRKGITREQLADAAGITKKQLDDWLSRRTIPDREADILMDALNTFKRGRRRGCIPMWYDSVPC